jgi:hypothetical protein
MRNCNASIGLNEFSSSTIGAMLISPLRPIIGLDLVRFRFYEAAQ